MTRLTVHTADSAPEGSRGFIDTVITNNGFLPNLIGVLAGAPVALETYLTVSGINVRASLTLQEREVVQITAASVHGCDFCVAGHTAIALKKAGFEKDVAKRTLTNLYNQRPAWLAQAHEVLDAAVAAAYGWSDYTNTMPDDEILRRLLALNLARAEAQQLR